MSAYEYEKVMDFVDEEDVKFIRLAFLMYSEYRKIFPLCRDSWRERSGREFLLMHQRWKVLEMK